MNWLTTRMLLFTIVIFSNIYPLQIFASEVTPDKFIAGFSVDSNEVGVYEKYEISFQLQKQYDNPFNPQVIDIQAHFISPSGKEEAWPAFWYQDYDMETRTGEVNRRGQTRIVSRDFYYIKGKPEWKIRYAPTEIGVYNYYLTIAEGKSDQVHRYPADNTLLSFISVESDKKGFITVSANDHDYFAFNDGSTFFPHGHGPDIDKRRFQKFIDYHLNIVQSEFNQDFQLEHEKVGEYDLERAFKADELLTLLEEHEIYLQIVFESWPNWADQATEANFNVHWDENPYNRINGGSLEYPLQFDYDEQAKQYFKNKVRYYIARWGYSGNVFCWQLWGEYDMRQVMASPEGQRYYSARGLLEWHQEMSNYIKGWDKRHMVTTAEAMIQPFSDTIWNFDYIDYISMHNYSVLLEWKIPQEIEKYRNMNAGKPILIQEYGPEALQGSSNLSLEAYRLAFHNPLWIAVLSKCAGLPMKWAWSGDPQEEVMNLDNDYYMMYNFFHNADLANEKIVILDPIDLTPKERFKPLIHRIRERGITIREGGLLSPVKIMGIGNNYKAYIWVKDMRFNVYEVHNENYQSKVMKNVKFQLSNPDGGLYTVEFWDTRSGVIIQTKQVELQSGKLIVEVPDFKNDLAIKIYKSD